MNVLYITYDGLTDPLGQSQVLPYLIGLTNFGHTFTIISCEKEQKYVLNKKKILELIKDRPIKWVPLKYTSKPPILSTIFDIIKIKKQAKKIFKEQNIEIVHCRSYITSFVGLYLKRRFGLKFVFDMRGFYADERVDGGLWNIKNPLYKSIYKYFKKKEVEYFTEADYVISLTENGRDEIHTWKNISNQPIPIEVIPCCVDIDFFSEKNINKENLNKLKNELSISSDDFIISYLGSIGTWYMLDEMLAFFKRLLLSNDRARFLFITPDDKHGIIERAKDYGIGERSLIIVQAAREEVPIYSKLSNVSLFFIKPVYSKRASSPTKQGEIMSLGIPIICNSNVGDTDRIIRETNSGYVINEFTDEEYDKAIRNLPQILSLPKENIIRSAEKYFSLKKGVESYNKVYQTLKNK